MMPVHNAGSRMIEARNRSPAPGLWFGWSLEDVV